MIDLETMDTTSASAIMAIGAVKFNPNVWPQTTPMDGFYVAVDPESCQRFGMTISASTFWWWMKPEQDQGRKALLETPIEERLDLPSAIDGFISWCTTGPKIDAVWSNGANFDIMIMRTAMRVCQRADVPWHYGQERCFRTMKNLVELPKTKVAHHAMRDARQQALDLQFIVNKLGIKI